MIEQSIQGWQSMTEGFKTVEDCKPGVQFGICEHHTVLRDAGLDTEGLVLMRLQSGSEDRVQAAIVSTGEVVGIPRHFKVREVEPIDIARIMRETFGSCLIELVCPSCGVRLIHYDFSGPNVSCSECKAHGSVGSFHSAMVKHGVANSLELTAKWSKDFEVLNEIAVALRAPDRFSEAFRPLYGKSTDVGRPSRKATLDGPDPS